MSTSSETEFIGKRALVTGGTKGIGEAVAERLREAGATVLTAARTRKDHAAPGEFFVAADLTTAEGCAVVADAVRDQLGGIDTEFWRVPLARHGHLLGILIITRSGVYETWGSPRIMLKFFHDLYSKEVLYEDL
jgi:NAD(P)-dependent dehydrogenase (short-subunit alcohol dehydrogenase family)